MDVVSESNPVTEQMFTEFYRKGFNRTCSIFHKMGYSPEDCQDLAQEVYLLVWKNREQCRGSLVQFWRLQLYFVIHHVKLGRYVNSLDEAITVRNAEDELTGHTVQPVYEEEYNALVERALSRLPPVLKQDLLLELQGFNYKERYLILGIHPTKYSKLRAVLRDAFTE